MSEPPSLRGLSLRSAYATSSDSLLDDFYVPCLSGSIRYDRLAGFFSSAVIALAPLAFADFFRRGGKARLVCSPRLSEADYDAFTREGGSTDALRTQAIADLESLASQGPQAAALVRAMSSMVGAGVLQVKIAVPSSPQGLFHDKTGIFHDLDGNRVSFVGSTNESAAAWSGLINHEQIEAFPSWESFDNSNRSRRHARTFEETWLNTRRGLRVLNPDQAARLIMTVSPPDDLEAALGAVRRLRKGEPSGAPRDVTTPKELLPHQAAVLENWKAQNYRGLVAFATGAGKTLTGIAGMRQWCQAGRPAITLVPSELLQQQWMLEIRREYPEVSILRAGGEGNRDRWLEGTSNFTSANPSFGPRCLLATYQTARTDNFLSRVRGGQHLMLLADEVHRAGAPDTRTILDQIDAGARLGLSATPDRYGDATGTAAIYDYFAEVLEPRYGLADAIAGDRLVPYVYQFETCRLTDDEQTDYDALTSKLAPAIARERRGGGAFEPSEFLAGLLRKRARILKRAANKANLAHDVLRENYFPGQRWLVYCESVEHLRQVREALASLDLPLLEYHQAMPGDKGATLDYFTRRSGVLLAIKCLDEGVDIPATDHALILASTTNPREYIQRRGRVLRKAPGKYNAVIVDAIVTDPDGGALAQSELARAIEFASSSENRAVRFALENLFVDDRGGWGRLTEDQDLEPEHE